MRLAGTFHTQANCVRGARMLLFLELLFAVLDPEPSVPVPSVQKPEIRDCPDCRLPHWECRCCGSDA